MPSQSTSLYDIPRIHVWNAYGSYLQGSSAALFCVVSSGEISLETRSALFGVASRLGYGDSLCFVTLAPTNSTPGTLEPASNTFSPASYCPETASDFHNENNAVLGADTELPASNTTDAVVPSNNTPGSFPSIPLEGKELLQLIETLDPLCLVCCDQNAAAVLATAYHCSISLETKTTLLNRPFRGFIDLSHSLQYEGEKQKAWQLLRTLPSL